MNECAQCGGGVERAFRFCPWCAAPQRLKLVELFRGHAGIDSGSVLRASRYFGPDEDDRHVRFSVWHGDRAEAAVSLPEDEAARLAQFLGVGAAHPRPRRLVDELARLTGVGRGASRPSRARASRPARARPAGD